MRALMFAVVGLWAALASGAGTAATVLEPTSPWVVDYADNNCRLIRTFGADKHGIKLVFEQLAPHSRMTVMLVGKFHAETEDNVLGFAPLPGVQISDGEGLEAVGSSDSVVLWPRFLGRGRWGLIPQALITQMRKAESVAAEASPSAPADSRAKPVKWQDRDWSVEQPEQRQAEDAAFGERAGRVDAVILNPGRSGSISLHTGELAKPFEALEKCASDSLKDWGIDPAVDATIATGAHPATDPQRSFSSEDYPRAALESFKEDNFDVWLNIDAQGGIASCRVISHFASPEINDAICGMIRRKERFVPARTKDGTAVPDFFIQPFVFKIQ